MYVLVVVACSFLTDQCVIKTTDSMLRNELACERLATEVIVGIKDRVGNLSLQYKCVQFSEPA